jgi:hypothetical protein
MGREPHRSVSNVVGKNLFPAVCATVAVDFRETAIKSSDTDPSRPDRKIKNDQGYDYIASRQIFSSLEIFALMTRDFALLVIY